LRFLFVLAKNHRAEQEDLPSTYRLVNMDIGWQDSQNEGLATWLPAGTRILTLVSVEGNRWAIEDSFEAAKNELGLAHNETRSWHD
jgi:SRSO17 transposase